MTAKEFQKKYGHRDPPRARLQGSKPQQAPRGTLDKKAQGKKESKAGPDERTLVRIVGYHVRLLDEDNFRGGCKYLIDQLRYAGLIKDDTIKHIRLEKEQVKVGHFEEEGTELTIIYP